MPSGENCDGESQGSTRVPGDPWPTLGRGSLQKPKLTHEGFVSYLVHCSITSVWKSAWHTVGAQSILNAWRGRAGLITFPFCTFLPARIHTVRRDLQISQKSLFLPGFYFCFTKAKSLLYFICGWVPSLYSTASLIMVSQKCWIKTKSGLGAYILLRGSVSEKVTWIIA